MQEGTLPEGVDAASIEFRAAAGRVLALGEIERREVAIGLVGLGAGAAELLDEQAGNGERDIADHFGIHAEAALAREQAIVRIALFELAAWSSTIAGKSGW